MFREPDLKPGFQTICSLYSVRRVEPGSRVYSWMSPILGLKLWAVASIPINLSLPRNEVPVPGPSLLSCGGGSSLDLVCISWAIDWPMGILFLDKSQEMMEKNGSASCLDHAG